MMLWGLALVAASSGLLQDAEGPRRTVEDLRQGASCVIPEDAVTVRAVMDALSAGIERPLTLIGRARRPDEEMLNRELVLPFRTGRFWEVIGALEQGLGLELQTLRKDQIRFLEPRAKVEWLGDWQVHGAFRLRPYRRATQGPLMVRLQAEPWLDKLELKEHDATYKSGRGRGAKETESMAQGSMNNDSLLDYSLDYFFGGAGQLEGPGEVTGTLQVAAALWWREVELPAMKSLGKKGHKLGKGRTAQKVELLEAGVEEQGGKQRIKIVLTITDCPSFDSARLVSADGSEARWVSHSELGDGAPMKLMIHFDAESLQGDLDDAHLVLRIPGESVLHEVPLSFADISFH